jgi:hypothetical protein
MDKQLLSTFLTEECIRGDQYTLSEAIFLVAFGGWVGLQLGYLPKLDNVPAMFKEAGILMREGRIWGLKLKKMTEEQLRKHSGAEISALEEGLARGRERKAAFGIPEEQRLPKWLYPITGDSVKTFLELCVEEQETVSDPASFYEAYVIFCWAHERRPVKRPLFGSRLAQKTGVKANPLPTGIFGWGIREEFKEWMQKYLERNPEREDFGWSP